MQTVSTTIHTQSIHKASNKKY